MSNLGDAKKRFAIAVSFPGEHRKLVKNIVERLAEDLGRDRVFYDEWYEAELAGPDGDSKLASYYSDESELIIPFFSKHYEKPWCRFEWRRIKSILLERIEDRSVIPVDLDGTKIEGWLAIDFAIQKKGRTGKEIADLILDIYRLRQPAAPAPSSTLPAPSAEHIAPSRILRHSAPKLFGREAELAALDDAWENRDATHVFTFQAWGGAGKTALVSKWIAERFAKNGWAGVERYFDWSFYSQGAKETSQASADFFIAAALEFFGDPDPQKGSPWERGQRLADFVRRNRTLLVLDGIEPLQYPPGTPQAGELKDQALEALLAGLAAGPNPGLCLVTTRESLANLENFRDSTAPEKKLDSLNLEAAVALLESLEIDGSEEEMRKTWEETGGHALTLQLLGRFLADAHRGDLRKRDVVRFEVADRETPGRTAMKVMAAYENWLRGAGPDRQRDLAVLRLTGLFDRPASPDCLAALREKPAIEGLTDEIVEFEEWEWTKAVTDLEELGLISTSESRMGIPARRSRSSDDGQECPSYDSAIDAHPLVREYFARQLLARAPEEFRAAHSRLFDHLRETTEHQPATLAGLLPLYQAVTHGCLAGRHPEACDQVYTDRILRGTGQGGFYSWKQLGAIGADLGAVAAFFDSPWRRLSPILRESDQAWLLSVAAFDLRALGRLTEALEPMQAGLEMAVAAEDWKNAAIRASNLSELELTLGKLDEAVGDGWRSIEFADRSGDAFQRLSKRETAADALHLAGEQDEARALFEEAERMQAEIQPEFPLLYSMGGFRYCDLLLAEAERAAWRVILDCGDSSPLSGRQFIAAPADEGESPVQGSGRTEYPASGINSSAKSDDESPHSKILDACAEAKRRGDKMFDWRMETDPLLDIALDHLTLARAGLYPAILRNDPSELRNLNLNLNLKSEVDLALSGLRQAGAMNHLPRALLTAAFHHHLANPGDLEGTARFLNEAEPIARRGPMPLYLADVHLHRARIFRDRAELAKARALIEKHGYGRRREELADAEEAARHWPAAADDAVAPETEPRRPAKKSPANPMKTPSAFISYSHDNPAHSQRVLDFANALRAHGVDTELDQFHKYDQHHWPEWCRRQMAPDAHDYVLCICTEEYLRRIDNQTDPDTGKGVWWEGQHLISEIYNDKENRRFIPVQFDKNNPDAIHSVIREYTRFTIRQFDPDSDTGFRDLLHSLFQVTDIEKAAVGLAPDFIRNAAPIGESAKPEPLPPKPALTDFTAIAPDSDPLKAEADTRRQLLDQLVVLPGPLFKELLFGFDPKKVVSRETAQRQQAIEVLELAESRDDGLAELEKLLTEIRS